VSRGAEPAVVGLVPAAGSAKRLAPLPCSKELYPIGFRSDGENGELRPQVASHHLFQKFQRAGITTAYVVLRNGKWDIPGYFCDGRAVGLHLAYLVIDSSIGPPDTIDRAYAFVRNDSIAFGFPDILFGPDDVFERLLRRLDETRCDVVLGMYPTVEYRSMDMIGVDETGQVRSLELKPQSTTLEHTWACAVWRPTFTEFMHTFVNAERVRVRSDGAAYQTIDAHGDLPVGAVIKQAIEERMRVFGVVVDSRSCLDIGTPQNLAKALRAMLP
jgi:NDP-sugar pyrophosphorylase family protein